MKKILFIHNTKEQKLIEQYFKNEIEFLGEGVTVDSFLNLNLNDRILVINNQAESKNTKKIRGVLFRMSKEIYNQIIFLFSPSDYSVETTKILRLENNTIYSSDICFWTKKISRTTRILQKINN